MSFHTNHSTSAENATHGEGSLNSPTYQAHSVEDEGEWQDEDESDDDMDLEDSEDTDQVLEYEEVTEDDGDSRYEDAEDGLTGVEIEFSADSNDHAEASDSVHNGPSDRISPTEETTGPAPTTIPQNHIRQLAPVIMRILRSQGSVLWPQMEEEERPRHTPSSPLPKIPSRNGRDLMKSGIFGSNEYYRDILRKKKKKYALRIMNRELGLDPVLERKSNRLIAQGLIPSSRADTIIHYNSRCYSGQFSDDGNFFFSCSQDFKVRMYDTSNPYHWKYYKTVVYPYGQWTITDASLSPDNKYLAYSSISSVVCLASTDPSETGEQPWLLDFADLGGSRRHIGRRYHSFGVWSVRFSGDGRELVAGTGDNSVYVYDIESRQSILRIPGHTNDVNAVCFGDHSSPHILYSGSDDHLIKVWDRRSMGDSREAGVFIGHTEGVTYVDSKGDGRYVLSNGKDQTMKLWDLRKMTPPEKARNIDSTRYSTGFDYRFQDYPRGVYTAHPKDCSVVTYRGHRVLKTLIRCHFSPPGSTDARYVYTGSADGSVYVYNMDATLARKINVDRAVSGRTTGGDLEDSDDETDDQPQRGGLEACVRDASWHPSAPVIAATSWTRWEESEGACTVHTWNDGLEDDEAEPKMGRGVDHELRSYASPLDDFPPSRSIRSRLRSSGVPARNTNRLGDD